MRDLKFACPHCEQRIQCENSLSGQTMACPACARPVLVPPPPEESRLRVTTGKVPVPVRAHGAPRAAGMAAPPPPGALPLPRPQWSRYAIASLVLSCASVVLLVFGCVPGIVFGHLAQAELRRRPGLEGAGIARAGLVVGYAFLALFTLLGLWLLRRMLAAQ